MNQIAETMMDYLATLGSLREFMALGGIMMWFIAAASFILWLCVIERFYYFRIGRDLTPLKQRWHAHLLSSAITSWRLHHFRFALLAEQYRKNFKYLAFVKALVATLPLMGLLGTVLGMIEIFDLLSKTGAHNARALASGVSKATLPTLAGMVVALLGFSFHNLLERRAKKNMRQCENLLNIL